MAESEGDKGQIAEGMAEAGKDQAKPGAGTKGQPGKGADPAKLTEGMSEAGSGGEESEDESAGTKP